MATCAHLSQSCLQKFDFLTDALSRSDASSMHLEVLSLTDIKDERGRFRVWCGNLGALQRGHASLDYRLRDSPILQANVIKFLKELLESLEASVEVVSGERLPFEQQRISEESLSSGESDDDSDSSDCGSDRPPPRELRMRLASIRESMRWLNTLSFKIRNPSLRPTSMKATLLTAIDPDTGVDLFSVFATLDKNHVTELLHYLRADRSSSSDEYLIERLAGGITLRRKQFRYWQRHSKKIGAKADSSAPHNNPQGSPFENADPVTTNQEQTLTVLPKTESVPDIPTLDQPPQSVLSETDVTRYGRNLDDQSETGSIISYTTTARDSNGQAVMLPEAPRDALNGKDFVCPYCAVLCPARHGNGKAWRAHILRDLQPYMCTYKDCDAPDQLYSTRRQWVAHETQAHRQVWRCVQHPTILHGSKESLRQHYNDQHGDDLTEEQIEAFISVSDAVQSDTRSSCPICFEDFSEYDDTESHLAHHLERIAAFAFPRSIDVDDDGNSHDSDFSHINAPGSNESAVSVVLDSSTRITPMQVRDTCPSMGVFMQGRYKLATPDRDGEVLICGKCFKLYIEQTVYASSFRLDEEDLSVLALFDASTCDFHDPWVRMAWILMTRRSEPNSLLPLRRPSELLAVKTLNEAPCPDDKLDLISLGSVIREGLEGSVPLFGFTCPMHRKLIGLLLPDVAKGILDREREKIPVQCMFRPSRPDAPHLLETLMEIEDRVAHDRRLGGEGLSDMTPLLNIVRDECPGDVTIKDALWYYMPNLPEFCVCRPCFEELVYPFRSSRTDSLASSFNADARLLPATNDVHGNSCQLHPRATRMRNIWAQATLHNDFKLLEETIEQRRTLVEELLIWNDSRYKRLKPQNR